MNKKKRKWIIINAVAIIVILIVSLIINIRIYQGYRRQFTLVEDGAQYCYGIDSLNKDGNLLTLKGWFFELRSIQKIPQSVSKEDSEQMIALIPLNEAIIDTKVEDATVMCVEKTHDDRPDVNRYFSCEYDYSKCGFTASIDCTDLDLRSNSYRVAIKLDARVSSKAVLTNIYITEKGLSFTDPRQSPKLDTEGTDLDKIVKEGVRLVSNWAINSIG